MLNSGSGGYYTYATQSNAAPGNVIGNEANQANYIDGGVFSVTQSGDYDYNQNYLTDVGAFSGSRSFYGTFDQSGNVYQWNDLDGLASSGSSRGLRGGDWFNIGPFNLSSSGRGTDPPLNKSGAVGFRLAAPVAVPEPSTYAMTLAGLACGGYSLFRRRRARRPEPLAALVISRWAGHRKVLCPVVFLDGPRVHVDSRAANSHSLSAANASDRLVNGPSTGPTDGPMSAHQ